MLILILDILPAIELLVILNIRVLCYTLRFNKSHVSQFDLALSREITGSKDLIIWLNLSSESYV